MRTLCLVIGALGLAPLISAEPENPVPVETVETEAALPIPAVEDAIPEIVKALEAPTPVEFPDGLHMAVSGADVKVQEAVLQGLNHLHGGWNFEAARHFAQAMRRDPDCMLAHWGMVMALLVPTPETGAARNAAALRLTELVNRGLGSRLERGYAFGLISYLDEGPAAAANAFGKVAAEFPNDMQAQVFAALFGRTGYDDEGVPTADQRQAEESLERLVKAHPDSVIPLYALLMARAEALDLSATLPLARGLCERAPNYAPFRHLLGHLEWRCGNPRAAAVALGRAAGLYEAWMQREKAGVADCPEWVRSECYRAVALFSCGDMDTALAAAEALAAKPLDPKRSRSEGVRLALWEAKTLPARLRMARDGKGDIAAAIKSLPAPAGVKPFHDGCLAHWGIDGVRLVLEARRVIATGNNDEIRKVIGALDHHGGMMAKAQPLALEGGERSAWTRAFRAYETMVYETRGLAALAGPPAGRRSAYNWFQSAADAQTRATMLMPPVVVIPQSARVGMVLLGEKKPEEALELFEATLATHPNDLITLHALRQALQSLGKTGEAAAVTEKINELRGR